MARKYESLDVSMYQTAVRMPMALAKAIDIAIEAEPAVFTSRADFIRRAIENELKARGILKKTKRD